MDRDAAANLLGRLHQAQGQFYAGGATAPLRALLCADVAWHVPGASPIAGDYHGVDEVFAYFERRRRLAANTMRMYPRELLVGDGDRVASVTDGTATVGGVDRSWSTVGLYRVDGVLIAECWLLPLDLAAFDLFWGQRPRR